MTPDVYLDELHCTGELTSKNMRHARPSTTATMGLLPPRTSHKAAEQSVNAKQYSCHKCQTNDIHIRSSITLSISCIFHTELL